MSESDPSDQETVEIDAKVLAFAYELILDYHESLSGDDKEAMRACNDVIGDISWWLERHDADARPCSDCAYTGTYIESGRLECPRCLESHIP